jgi:hypothetical protein
LSELKLNALKEACADEVAMSRMARGCSVEQRDKSAAILGTPDVLLDRKGIPVTKAEPSQRRKNWL